MLFALVESQITLSLNQPEATDLRSVTTLQEPIDPDNDRIDGKTYSVNVHSDPLLRVSYETVRCKSDAAIDKY